MNAGFVARKAFAFILLMSLILSLSQSAPPTRAEGPEPSGGISVQASAPGTAFTYQGQVEKNGSPLNEPADFQFSLFDAEASGTSYGYITLENVPVSKGLFTVQLDFGAVFTGNEWWLQTAVRHPSQTGVWEVLYPRQHLLPVPYALYARSVGSVPWSGLSGVPFGFADGIDNDSGGTVKGVNAGSGLVATSAAGFVTVTVNFAGTGAAQTAARSDHNHNANYWSTTGNSGTSPATNYVGTTDNIPLELRANGVRALRLEPNTTSPNFIAGYSGNSVGANIYGATIGGGGTSGYPNTVSGIYGAIGGGSGNAASGDWPTIAGGWQNTVSAAYAAVVGGQRNVVTDTGGFVGSGYGNTIAGAYSAIAGGHSNKASNDYDAIGGGYGNVVSSTYGTVGGGYRNAVSGNFATVAGGDLNLATQPYASVGGGYLNEAFGNSSTVGGGNDNSASGASSTVGGGETNVASGASSTVGGGETNVALGASATVGGGVFNEASGASSTVGGGFDNRAPGDYATIPGGNINEASGNYSFAAGNRAKALHDGAFVWADSTAADYASTGKDRFMVRASGGVTIDVGSGALRILAGTSSPNVIAGYEGNDVGPGILGAAIGGGGYFGGPNSVYADYSAIGGGGNNVAGGQYSTIGGGSNNYTDGRYSTVPGGLINQATGDHSFAAGYNARASRNGSFVWADTNTAPFYAGGGNTFSVRATGGISLVTAINTSTGVPTAGANLAAGGGSWSSLSDRAAKDNFLAADPRDILRKLITIPVQSWNYKAQDPSIRHIGPVAQDFYAAFGVGEDEKYIATIDADGVALAAIQGLYEEMQARDAKIGELETQNASLKAQNASLEDRLAALEKAVAKLAQGQQ